MSLNILTNYIINNDLETFKSVMEDDNTYLNDKICTYLLVESLKNNKLSFANYILKYDFDLDGDIFDKYIEENRPFNEKQIRNLQKILDNFYMCCLLNK